MAGDERGLEPHAVGIIGFGGAKSRAAACSEHGFAEKRSAIPHPPPHLYFVKLYL